MKKQLAPSSCVRENELMDKSLVPFLVDSESTVKSVLLTDGICIKISLGMLMTAVNGWFW